MAKKLMISIDESLLASVERYAEQMHLNRSAAFSVLCSMALEQRKNMDTLNELMQAYKNEQAKQENAGA